MDGIKTFLKTSLLGGLIVILPVALSVFLISWIFRLSTGMLEPVAHLIAPESQSQTYLGKLLAFVFIISLCFVVGVFVRTKLGGMIFHALERGLLYRIPLYSLIKETVFQFLGNKETPFSSVALAKLYGNDTLASAFITEKHPDGSYSIFVPTGPNPTSGNIFHLKKEFVFPLKVPIEDAMRSIISCGAGSSKLLEAYKRDYPQN